MAGAQHKSLAPAISRTCTVSQRPFPAWAHWPSAVLCDTPSAKVGVFLALSSPTFQRHCHCTAFCGIPSSKVGVSMAISSPTFRKRCPYTALCGTPPAKVWYFSRFSPLPPDCTRPLRHSLSVFKSSPIDYQVDLSYTTAPVLHRAVLQPLLVQEWALFGARRSCARLPYRRKVFSVPDVPESGSRTGEDSFLYRTENRPEVIEL